MAHEIESYDIEGMKQELQKVLRIQDWDVKVLLVGNPDIYDEYKHIDVCGDCERDRNYTYAVIQLNLDHRQMQVAVDGPQGTGWLYVLIHEMVHIVTDGLIFAAEGGCNTGFPEVTKVLNGNLEIQNEKLTNQLTKTILSLMDVEAFLARHRKEEPHAETEASQ